MRGMFIIMVIIGNRIKFLPMPLEKVMNPFGLLAAISK